MLRSLARAAALRYARRLVLPELRRAIAAAEARTWEELIEHLGYLAGLELRYLDVCQERDEFREGCDERDRALEELRDKLAVEQLGRGTALLVAQRDAHQKRAEEAEGRLERARAEGRRAPELTTVPPAGPGEDGHYSTFSETLAAVLRELGGGR